MTSGEFKFQIPNIYCYKYPFNVKEKKILIKYWYQIRFLIVKKDLKYFIGYSDGKVVRPLTRILPKISAFMKQMLLSSRYKTIRIKISSLMKKKLQTVKFMTINAFRIKWKLTKKRLIQTFLLKCIKSIII